MSIYSNATDLLGPLSEGGKVRYRAVFSRGENVTLIALSALAAASGVGLLVWLALGTSASVAGLVLAGLMVTLEGVRLTQTAALVFFAARAKDPVPLVPQGKLRAAVLTTIVPGKEPWPLVRATLRAMLRIRHDGPMDVWLLDEGNDPGIRAACLELGVKHFSRNGRPEYNQPAGEFKTRTKHGNHNAWRAENEDKYDVVAQMDPDHVPCADFLERLVGFFNDPDVAFVVAPQVYGNIRESWIARGSAFLAYIFHGIIQRGGNGMSAPLLIGTNHVYRVSAFKQIGGYQDSIIEDHLTSMALFAARNSVTGNRWQGVYTPDIVSVGEGPTSFTDFFNQQKRWAYGIWEILFSHSPRLFGQMRPRQRLSFALLQMFYPSVAISWVLSIALNAVFLLGGGVDMPIVEWGLWWGLSFGSSLALFLWFRRFNLVEHERRDWGLTGMVLMLLCVPVYTAAAIRRCTGRRLAYAVTAKGDLSSPDSVRTFTPHLWWAGVVAVLLAVSVASSLVSVTVWLVVSLGVCVAPLGVHYGSRLVWRGRVPARVAVESA